MYSAAHAVNTVHDILQTALPRAHPPLSSADVNMQFLSASRRAVFTCRLSHVILQERTLILLHCPSTVNSCTKSTSFHSILTASQRHSSNSLWLRTEKKKKSQRLGRETLKEGGNESNPYHNFPSRPPGDVLWFTTLTLHLSLSLSLARPTLPPTPSLSRSLSLSYKLCFGYWCVLIWRMNGEYILIMRSCIQLLQQTNR